MITLACLLLISTSMVAQTTTNCTVDIKNKVYRSYNYISASSDSLRTTDLDALVSMYQAANACYSQYSAGQYFDKMSHAQMVDIFVFAYVTWRSEDEMLARLSDKSAPTEPNKIWK